MDRPPPGYEGPTMVYSVEFTDETGDECLGQAGGFWTEVEAEALRQRLADEGRWVRINMLPIHRRVIDWEYDR